MMFGRYWPGNSPLHRLDPRTKVLATLYLVVIVFLATNGWSMLLVALFCLGAFALGRISPWQAIKSIAPLLFIIVLTMLFNLLFVTGGDTYVDWGWLQITQEGVQQALFIGVRLLLLLLFGSLLTLTTTSLDITEAFDRLLSPLGRLGAPTHEFAFVMGVALRFLPEFAKEFAMISKAQESRGAKLSTSPLRTGTAAITSLIVPLFASVFRHADTLSAAMEARCYHGGADRTRLHPLELRRNDLVAMVVLVALGCAVIALSVLL